MGFISVLSFAHKLISERLHPGDSAIDATAGTGADTLFLARTCGARGHVYAFDIQEEALALTRARLEKEPQGSIAEVTLIHRSHSEMEIVISDACLGRCGAVMFNLGYLPAEGADPTLITTPESTIPALEAAIRMLRPRGVLTAVLYPGHPGGDREAAEVEHWASSLPYLTGQSIIYRQLQRADAPFLIAIEKK